jgi:hypothetical protein
VPFNHVPKSEARELFDRKILRMAPDEVARYWIDRRIRGQKGPPTTAASGLIARVVGKLPGAMSYVFSDELIFGVRALTIDGKAPASSQYPLR